jgi:hypothetical protein
MSWTTEDLEAEEAERIVESALLALYAAQIPRRVNGASARELSKDKKVSRIVAAQYLDLWRAMTQKREAPKCPDWEAGMNMANYSTEARQAGAQVVWKRWLTERSRELQKRRRQLAAYSLREGLSAWGARRVMLIDKELAGISRALKKLNGGSDADPA